MLGTALDLIDYAGGRRGELIRLRCQVRASQGMDIPAWCPREGKR